MECEYCNGDTNALLRLHLNTITLETLLVCDSCMVELKSVDKDSYTELDFDL